MRKRFLLSLLVALLTTLSLHAYDFQSGDLYYNITSNTTVEVSHQEYGLTNYQGLTTATIPETVTYNGTTYSVTSIGKWAFSDCSSLTSITCLAQTPPTCENTCFDEVPRTIPLYVPAESVKDYKNAAVWQEFYIEGKSDAPTAIKNALNTDTKGGQKIIRDGQVLILRNGETYDMMGQTL